eukprot:144864-Chlamydomonas_euryale.AAC.3
MLQHLHALQELESSSHSKFLTSSHEDVHEHATYTHPHHPQNVSTSQLLQAQSSLHRSSSGASAASAAHASTHMAVLSPLDTASAQKLNSSAALAVPASASLPQLSPSCSCVPLELALPLGEPGSAPSSSTSALQPQTPLPPSRSATRSISDSSLSASSPSTAAAAPHSLPGIDSGASIARGADTAARGQKENGCGCSCGGATDVDDDVAPPCFRFALFAERTPPRISTWPSWQRTSGTGAASYGSQAWMARATSVQALADGRDEAASSPRRARRGAPQPQSLGAARKCQ